MPRCLKKTVDGLRCKNKCCNGLKVCVSHSDNCPICLEKTSSGDEVCTLICGHAYHTCCVYPWFENDHRCPYCRTSVRRPKIKVQYGNNVSREIVNSHYLRNLLGSLYDQGLLSTMSVGLNQSGQELFVVDLETSELITRTMLIN